MLCDFPIIWIHVARLEGVKNSGGPAELRFVRVWVDVHAENFHWASELDWYHGHGVAATIMDTKKGVRLCLVELAFKKHDAEPWPGYIVVQAT